MRVRTSFLLAVAVAAAPSLAAAQGAFEGVITFRMDAGQGGPSAMQYSVKDGHVRMDISAQGMTMFTLYDGAAKTVDMVIPMQQMYMERTVNPQALADSANARKHDITWTGRKETVAGHECEHATISDDTGQTSDVCLAKGLGTFVQMGGGMRGRGAAQGGGWESHVGDAFPLKVEQGGRVVMEATTIEKKSLDASLFKVPDGYHKMSMPFGGRGGR
ncbi:MAG TPA: DUF4412 domain-containing protein [Gemmatimonadaceae bacterium]|nr:DUF4412 domain-containing protein [Gemmatimonadaceae bacterium]